MAYRAKGTHTVSQPKRITRTTVFDILDERGTPDTWLARRMGTSSATISRIRYGKQPIAPWFVEKAPLIFGLPKELLFPELAECDDADVDSEASIAS